MPEDQKDVQPNAGATDTGGAAGGGADSKAKWTADDWEKHVQREADRCVTDALKKQEEKYSALLADTKTSAETKLKDYETQLATARTQADFMATATAQGVGDPRAAWAIAREFDHIKDGKVDWEKMKADHPLLFGGTARQSSAAASPDIGGGKPDINKLLRQAAGYRS